MKYKFLLALSLGILLVCFIVYACQEDIARQQDEILTSPKNENTVMQSTNTHKIICVGSCQVGEHPHSEEGTCEAMLYDGNAGTIECPCTSCAMQVSSHLTKVSPYFQYFNEHLTEKIGTLTTILYSIEIEEHTNAEVVIFEYRIPNTSNRETVMYIKNYSTTGEPAGPPVEIDCYGNCDNSRETCKERYIASTGNVECTCEGNCRMRIIRR